jgi:hypothetical protein
MEVRRKGGSADFIALIGALTLFGGASAAAVAGELAKPQGKVVLTVTGRITNKNAADAATLDLAMLEALPKRISAVRTPWTSGVSSFEGPLGAAVLDAVGASGSTLHVTALDDYAADIPVEDFRKYPVILASRMNGQLMPDTDKEPLFIIYPFDLHPGIYTDAYFSRSVWQVKAIDIR